MVLLLVSTTTLERIIAIDTIGLENRRCQKWSDVDVGLTRLPTKCAHIYIPYRSSGDFDTAAMHRPFFHPLFLFYFFLSRKRSYHICCFFRTAAFDATRCPFCFLETHDTRIERDQASSAPRPTSENPSFFLFLFFFLYV